LVKVFLGEKLKHPPPAITHKCGSRHMICPASSAQSIRFWF